ncbi:MAG: class sortase, partial [Conexibacter sp.]|nr:class sortase [Conexibacter sp.]
WAGHCPEAYPAAVDAGNNRLYSSASTTTATPVGGQPTTVAVPLYPLAVTVPVLVALAVTLWNAIRRPEDSAAWLIYALLLLAGLVVGVALLADGILTIVWQEPITALQQSHDQAELRTDLSGLQHMLAAAPKAKGESAATRMRRQALTLLDAKRPDGSAMGSIDIPRIGLKTVFVESTTHPSLKKGPGHYRGTVLPGLVGTVGLAGHRTTYGAPFRRVDELSPGSRIIMRMPYGQFTYKVTGTRITTPSDASSLVSRAGSHKLVLTACHPLYSAAKRIVVSARLVSSTPA